MEVRLGLSDKHSDEASEDSPTFEEACKCVRVASKKNFDGTKLYFAQRSNLMTICPIHVRKRFVQAPLVLELLEKYLIRHLN